jgi:hypothetical protein
MVIAIQHSITAIPISPIGASNNSIPAGAGTASLTDAEEEWAEAQNYTFQN